MTVTKTTLTALAGILIAVNLRFHCLPLTRDDTEMVAVALGFLSQIFQRHGTKKAEEAAKAAAAMATVAARNASNAN